MRWEKGRQGGGYEKLLLFQGKTWDLWLLYYPVGMILYQHTDPVEGKKHYRLNFLLREDKGAGFSCRYPRETKRWWRFIFFRPDNNPHMVSLIQENPRWVLSLGWVRPTGEIE